VTSSRRPFAVILLATVVALAGSGVASAHAVPVATDPAQNASLTTGPARVSATFNEALQSAFAAMTVVGPDGKIWSSGEPEVQGAVISVGVSPLGPAGTYTVNYRVTSADGHPVSGSWSFTLTQPGTGTAGRTPSAGPSPGAGGLPVWPFVAGAAVLIVSGALFAVRGR
jgi:copper resistance protein C